MRSSNVVIGDNDLLADDSDVDGAANVAVDVFAVRLRDNDGDDSDAESEPLRGAPLLSSLSLLLLLLVVVVVDSRRCWR
jgi:hypothetical protein